MAHSHKIPAAPSRYIVNLPPFPSPISLSLAHLAENKDVQPGNAHVHRVETSKPVRLVQFVASTASDVTDCSRLQQNGVPYIMDSK